MRNFILIILVLIITGGFAWKYYQPEIRKLLGLAAVSPVEEEFEKSSADSGHDEEPEPSKDLVREEREPSSKKEPVKDASDEAAIQRIVNLRFPEVELLPFSERFKNLEDIPLSAFPDRIKVASPVEFSQTDNGETVAVSYLKKGGMARPTKIETDGSVIIESLANSSMKAKVQLEETDLNETLQTNHDLAYRQAAERVLEMRELETSDLRGFNGLLDEWKNAEVLWESPEENHFKSIQLEIERRLNSDTHRIVGFWQDLIRIDRETHVITTALVEGTNHGFGPFHWRVQCQSKRKEIVKMEGLPDAPLHTD